MDRIAELVSLLQQEMRETGDPARLLPIVQSLQFELSQVLKKPARNLGTAKVAVLMPAGIGVAEEEKSYVPRPHKQETESHRVRETVLVDKGSVSLVQKNGQLDMVFDPMTEIPTLSHQPELQNGSGEPESLNDKLRQGRTELIEVLKESPVKDLRKAIGINDRFVFIRELFQGDEVMYERSVRTINNFNIFPEADYWINRELRIKLGWSNDNPAVQHFYQLVKRRFS